MAGDAHQSARAHSNRRCLCLLMPMLLISALCSTAQRTYVRWAAFLSQLNRSTRSVNPPLFRRIVSDLECRVVATTPVDLQAPLVLRRLSLCAFTTVSLRCAAPSLRWRLCGIHYCCSWQPTRDAGDDARPVGRHRRWWRASTSRPTSRPLCGRAWTSSTLGHINGARAARTTRGGSARQIFSMA